MSHLIRQLVLEVIQERSWSLSAVSRRLTASEDRSRLSKMLRGVRPFSVDDLHQVLAIIGEPEPTFWRRYLNQIDLSSHTALTLDIDPATVLAAIAGQKPPLLPLVIRQLDQQQLPRLERDVNVALPASLKDLDRLRLQDKQAALEQAEKWIGQCRERLFAERHEVRQLVELIAALGFWASVTRSTGKSRTAAAVFNLAFRLCGPIRSTVQYAFLLWRSSHVLIDSGFPAIAQVFVERAYTLFDVRADSQRAIDVLLSLGSQAAYSGQWPLAQCSFERCLSHSGVSQDQKAAAISNLAALHDQLGAYETVLTFLEKHESLLQSSQPRYCTSARWIQARAMAQGNGQQQVRAEEIFSSIRPAVARYCEPLDPFLFFCDHAAVLIRLDDQTGLRAAAGAIAGLLPRLESTPLYEKVSQEVVGILSGVRISTDDLKRLRQDLGEVSLPDR